MVRKMLFRLSGLHILMTFLLTIDQTCSFDRKDPIPAVKIEEIDEYERILSEYSDRHEGKAKILISFDPGHRDIDDDDVGPGTKFAAELAIKLQNKDYMSYSTLHTMAGNKKHEEFLRRLKHECKTLILIVTQQYLENLDNLDILDKAIDYDTNIIPVLYGMNNMPDDTKWWPNAIGPVYKSSRNKVIGSAELHNAPFKVRELHLGPNEDLVNRIIRLTHGVTRKHVQEWQKKIQALSELNKSKKRDLFISYSTGNTEHDDQSLGTGTKFVAELAIKLEEEEGIRTDSNLHINGGELKDEYEKRLKNECKVLVLILTAAFFKSDQCLKELYMADTERVRVFPVRYDSFPKNEEDWWPNLPNEEYENMRRAVIKEGKLDVQLFNDYYDIDEPTDELVDALKKQLSSAPTIGIYESIVNIIDGKVSGDTNGSDVICLILGTIALCFAVRFVLSRHNDPFVPVPPPDVSSSYKYDAFLSHNWGKDEIGRDNHARVMKINQALTGRGVRTWIDEKEMQGNIDHRMSRGIQQSMIVIVFVTKKYIEKVDSDGNDNCLFEFQHAKNHRTVQNMIPVVMEEGIPTWTGPVGIALGSHLYYSFKTDDELNHCVKALVEQIEKRKQH